MSKSKIWCLIGVHEWKIIAKGPYTLTQEQDYGHSVKHGEWFVLQCQVCGSVRHRKLV